VTAHFTWHRFAAIQIWIFILFLIYTSIVELNAVLGGGRLGKIFFARRSSESLRNVKGDKRLEEDNPDWRQKV
jgi:hypothetical protein